MSERTDPVLIELNCEAQEGADTVEVDRTEWNALTPTQRAVLVQELAAEHMNNQGGYGWHIDNEDDMESVGPTPTLYPVDVEAAMKLVVQYGVECRQNGPLTDNAEQWLTRIRKAITGKEA